MNPSPSLSPNQIISSETIIVIQPDHPAAHMNVALYKAATQGKIEEFNIFQGYELESLLTPNPTRCSMFTWQPMILSMCWVRATNSTTLSVFTF